MNREILKRGLERIATSANVYCYKNGSQDECSIEEADRIIIETICAGEEGAADMVDNMLDSFEAPLEEWCFINRRTEYDIVECGIEIFISEEENVGRNKILSFINTKKVDLVASCRSIEPSVYDHYLNDLEFLVPINGVDRLVHLGATDDSVELHVFPDKDDSSQPTLCIQTPLNTVDDELFDAYMDLINRCLKKKRMAEAEKYKERSKYYALTLGLDLDSCSDEDIINAFIRRNPDFPKTCDKDKIGYEADNLWVRDENVRFYYCGSTNAVFLEIKRGTSIDVFRGQVSPENVKLMESWYLYIKPVCDALIEELHKKFKAQNDAQRKETSKQNEALRRGINNLI